MSEKTVDDTVDEGQQEEQTQVSEQVKDEPKSMDDTIRETYADIQARGEGISEEEGQEKPEKIDGRKTRERGPDGKYLPKAGETSQEAQAAEAKPAAAQEIPQSNGVPEWQRLGIRKEEADAFSKADPVVRDAFIRRTEEMQRGFEQIKGKAQFGDQMERAIQPFMATIQSLGVGPDVAINKLLIADHSLRYGNQQQKAQMLQKIAQDYGVDLGQAQQFQAAQPYVDPQVHGLQSQVQQMQQWIQQEAAERRQREDQALLNEVNSFAQGKEHWNAVFNEMGAILPAVVKDSPHLNNQEKLQKAYDMAIYANPTVRTQVLAKQQAEAEEQRRQEATQRAQAAKGAAKVNLPRKGALPAARAVGSIDDTIRETAEALGLM